MKLFVTITLLLAASVALAQPPLSGRGGFRFGGGVGLGAFTNRTITGAPFSALWNVQRQQVLSNGNQLQRQEQGSVNRDSQGRVRVETTAMITIYDPVAGSVYRLNPQRMTGVQSPIHQRNQPPSSGSNNAQPQTQDLGTQTINGVSAAGTQVTRTIPAGAAGNSQPIPIVRVTWVSTALQVPVQVTFTDPRSGNEQMNLTSIVQSEPNGSLFVVPSGYTITQAPGRGR